jgi:signal transduction histidine kinase
LNFEDKKFEMTVEDDGIGIPDNTRKGGNGLVNMNKRCVECHGSMDIKSTKDGTIIKFIFPY